MEYIAHRINDLNQLRHLPTEYGCEIDLRPRNDKLVLAHDPFCDGDSFEDWIREYKHGTLILNIKSERIEFKVKEILEAHKIQNYFFLDSSFPMIRSLSEAGEKKIALRFSEYEGPDVLRAMQGKVNWVWVDCFTRLAIDQKTYQEVKSLGYKICLVSPELQGRQSDIAPYARNLLDMNILPDAICTKIHNIKEWTSYFPS